MGEVDLFLGLAEGIYGADRDPELQELFDDALFNPDLSDADRADAYDMLLDYMWEAYHLDFEDVFDWDGYREWYG